ncbi:MAG: PEGA domain-containing protein [Myxococcales bacterium]|nr:PEGA domain-containing protein [Myxococcales bacterium]MCB9568382.1 PEGA domain-containing protein [Myxococcales bacterium]MCB9705106.1 PEGA domain-containing protein [Myxococcales bacterium]
MFGRRALALVLAPALGFAPLPVMGVAQAADEAGVRLAILPIQIEGEISDADRQDLTRALVTGFERGSFAVVAPEQVVGQAGDPGACGDAACITGVAGKTQTAYVAVPQVRVNDRDYAIQVALYNGTTGERVAVSEDACEICGVVDASGLLDSAAATLSQKLDALAKGPASLVLTSEPEGAVVMVDGELIGTAPLDQPIPPGKHILRISQDGYIPVEREVTFVEGVREELSISLEKMPSALPGRGWGWASLSVGIVSLGGAGVLTFMHDRPYRVGDACSITAPDPDYNVMNDPAGNEVCRHVWDTKWGGLALGIAGAALTTLGVLVLIDNYKRSDRSRRKAVREKEREKASARFGVGPGSVLIRGRF